MTKALATGLLAGAALAAAAFLLLGTIDAERSGWCTFWFETYHARHELESMGEHFREVTLHVHASDLPAGKHEGVGSWRKVIVGDRAWEKITAR